MERSFYAAQDQALAEREREIVGELKDIRKLRKEYARMLSVGANGVAKQRQQHSKAKPPPLVKQRPRRGWTTVIRSVLAQNPGITFKDLFKVAKTSPARPENVTDDDYRDRLRFALRDMAKKGFVTTAGERGAMQYTLKA